MSRSAVTTHVLDAARGRPAAGVHTVLERVTDDGWEAVGSGTTDADGRIADLAPGRLGASTYRIRFDTAAYWAATDQRGFYPEVVVVFALDDPDQHHHVPLLLSPFAFSTYRGS